MPHVETCEMAVNNANKSLLSLGLNNFSLFMQTVILASLICKGWLARLANDPEAKTMVLYGTTGKKV